MDIHDLTISQLKRAVSIKEKIEDLSRELRTILGSVGNLMPAQKRKRGMSAAQRRKIAASQKARWAKLRRAKSTRPGKPAKKATNASANARRSAKLKAYWAAKKRAAKK